MSRHRTVVISPETLIETFPLLKFVILVPSLVALFLLGISIARPSAFAFPQEPGKIRPLVEPLPFFLRREDGSSSPAGLFYWSAIVLLPLLQRFPGVDKSLKVR